MATISEIKTLITGQSRLNRFRVTLPTPDGVINEVYVRAAALPGRSVEVVEIMHRGAKIKVGGEPSFNDWVVEMYAEEFSEYQRIYNWLESIAEVNSNTRGNPSLYKSNGVKVEQIGSDNSVVATAILDGVFPTTVDDISYSSDAGDFTTFSCTFSVDSVRFEGTETESILSAALNDILG